MIAEDHLLYIEQESADFARRTIAQGILWADQSCRISGTLSLAIRRSGAAGAEALVCYLIASGLTTQAEVPRFLNENKEAILQLLEEAKA